MDHPYCTQPLASQCKPVEAVSRYVTKRTPDRHVRMSKTAIKIDGLLKFHNSTSMSMFGNTACFKSCEILGAILAKRWGKHPNTPPHHVEVNRIIFLRRGHDGVKHAAVTALGYTYVSAIFLLDCRLQPPKKKVYAHERSDQDFATSLAVCLSWGASQPESSYCLQVNLKICINEHG